MPSIQPTGFRGTIKPDNLSDRIQQEPDATRVMLRRIVLYGLLIAVTTYAIAWGTVVMVESSWKFTEAYKAWRIECGDAWLGTNGKEQRFLEKCRRPFTGQ